MIARILSILLVAASSVQAQEDARLATQVLPKVYAGWRDAMLRSDAAQWRATTAAHRQMEVRNRLASEKRPFPAGVFQVPVPPPALDGLKAIHVSRKGPTAKVAYYGKIDFGVGGDPDDNILLLSFVGEDGSWKYDKADFVNLAALPEVRKEIAAGDLSYIRETPEFRASGSVPRPDVAVPRAQYIAKIYVFCPGREVTAQVNRISRHRFANTKESEVVLGGARDGRNDVVFRVNPLEGGTGREAFTVRVYLMSEIPGTKPIKAYEYLVNEGEEVESLVKGAFTVDPATAAKLVP